MTDDPLRDSAIAVARGDLRAAGPLYIELQKLATQRLSSFDAEVRERAPETVLLRWQGSLDRNLASLADHRGVDAGRQVRSSSRRGASRAEIEDALGRALSVAEAEAIDPFVSDQQARSYFLQSLRHAAIEAVRCTKARARAHEAASHEIKPAPTTPLLALPEEVLARATALLDNEILPSFLVSNPNESRWLAELEAGLLATEAVERRLGKAASPADVALGTALVYQHWTRARRRLLKSIEERRGDRQFRRETVPALRLLIDERYRRHKAGVRTRAGARLHQQKPKEHK